MNLPSGEHHERALEAAAAKAGAFWIARESIIAYFTELERQGVRPVYVPKCKPCDGSGERYGDGYESDIGPCPDCGGSGFERVVPLAEATAALRTARFARRSSGHDAATFLERRFGGGER